MTAERVPPQSTSPAMRLTRKSGNMVAAVVIVVAGSFLALPGCNGKQTTSDPGAAKSTDKSDAKRAEDRCATLIAAVGDIFQLSHLGVSSQISDGVNRLNDWQRSCGGTALDAPATVPDPIAKTLTSHQSTALNERRFTIRDGNHMRDCMLLKEVATYAVGQAENDLERVVNLFDHVVRNIELVPRHAFDLPLPIYYTCLLGKGTVSDRAWMFAGLLRQIQIDAVIVLPAGSSHDAGKMNGPFLVGVPLEGRIYLFDPEAGIPVPALPSDGSRPRTAVATLDQAAGDPQILRQLDAGEEHRYPIQTDQLKKLQVALITDTAYWSVRMRALAEQLSGAQSLAVYDPLNDNEALPGLWKRIVSAGGSHWSAEAISVWSYPESQQARHADLNDEELRQLAILIDSWNAFLMVVIGPNGQPALTEAVLVKDPAGNEKVDPNVRVDVHSTQGEQRRARLAQAGGRFAEALKGYIEVRGGCMRLMGAPLPIEDGIRARHIRAEDDAAFWIGLCKVEQEEYAVAATLLDAYREKHPKGAWLQQARFLSALSLAALGKTREAIAQLESTPTDSPEYLGHQYRIRQWRAAKAPGP